MVILIIASKEAWSEPYAIVGNVIGYPTIIFIVLTKYVPMIKLGCTSSWLHRYFTAACPNIAPSCRLEFALAGKGLVQ